MSYNTSSLKDVLFTPIYSFNFLFQFSEMSDREMVYMVLGLWFLPILFYTISCVIYWWKYNNRKYDKRNATIFLSFAIVYTFTCLNFIILYILKRSNFNLDFYVSNNETEQSCNYPIDRKKGLSISMIIKEE